MQIRESDLNRSIKKQSLKSLSVLESRTIHRLSSKCESGYIVQTVLRGTQRRGTIASSSTRLLST